jgi:hypothetical protein
LPLEQFVIDVMKPKIKMEDKLDNFVILTETNFLYRYNYCKYVDYITIYK